MLVLIKTCFRPFLNLTSNVAKKSKKTTIVHTHPRRVKPSPKNPTGVTIVDEHLRRLPGTYLDEIEIY